MPGPIDALRPAQADDRELRRQLEDVRALHGEKARALEAEIVDLLARHRADYRERFLGVGGAGLLFVAGELPQVLPLDDAVLLDAARPVSPDDKIRTDPEKEMGREDAQVRPALVAGPCAVIVLGGGARPDGKRAEAWQGDVRVPPRGDSELCGVRPE
jgi:hypothetical protein